MQAASNSIYSSDNTNYKISVQYQLVDVVGVDFDDLDDQIREQADPDFYSLNQPKDLGFTHSGQNLGPGIQYELQINGTFHAIGSSLLLDSASFQKSRQDHGYSALNHDRMRTQP